MNILAGRPPKTGIDFFPLDVIFDDDVELIEAECGLDGLAILIKLWQKVYQSGYYIKWDNDIALLFGKKINAEKNKVSSVINTCFRRNIFNKNLFDKYGILTSSGIQKRYLSVAATAKRVYVPFDRRFLLVFDERYTRFVTEWIGEKQEFIPQEIGISSGINGEEIQNTSGLITEEKPISSPERKGKKINNICSSADADVEKFFEDMWALYPRKEGKGRVSKTQKENLYKLGDEFKRCIERYKKEKAGVQVQFLLYGSSFFNSGYVDYLDKNYNQAQAGEAEEEYPDAKLAW